MTVLLLIPGLSLRSNPGLKLANASGVIGDRLRRIHPHFKVMHYKKCGLH